ncbi:MAG: hypothetical protein ACWA41_06245 [Putridiphycobacter sp.]
MIQKIILNLFTLFITSTSFACTCAYQEEFNLLDYDAYKYIFEVKIESPYEQKNDSLNSDQPNLPSPYEFGLLNGYNISIIEVFKGDIKLSETVMGFSRESSCSWKPKIGATYIFYASSLDGVEACNRKLINENNQERYRNEKLILRSLKSKLKKIKIKSNGKTLITGKYRKKKREGIWKIYSTNEQNKVALILNYTNGQLTSVKKEGGYSEEDEWLKMSYTYYLKKIN